MLLQRLTPLSWFLCLLVASRSCAALTVTFDFESAKAVLQALGDPSLTYDQALKIGQMAGNQGMIRKQNEFNIPVTTESFAKALMAAARDQKVDDPTQSALYFDKVRPKAASLLALIHQMEANPEEFQGSIEKRIALFAPPASHISLQGYVVAGGDGGGYAFGDTSFYLNLEFIEDLAVGKTTATHELYHAVQGAYASDRQTPHSARLESADQACDNIAHLFAAIYEEGSAMYVEDFSSLAQSHSESAIRQLTDINEGLAHLDDSATLLELSVVGLAAKNAVPFKDVYAVGFYGHGVLYDIGTAMARAIAEQEGPQGLAAFLKQPPYRFALYYTRLPNYGADKDHPKLGTNTMNALNRLAQECR